MQTHGLEPKNAEGTTLLGMSQPGMSRSTSATIHPTILRYLLVVGARHGVDLEPALTSVGLDLDVIQSAELRVSYRQGSAVIRTALKLTGDPQLGLEVGAAQSVTAWGPLGLALLASETLQEAVELGVRYQNLTGAMLVFTTQRDEAGFALHAELPDPGMDPEVGVFLVDEAMSGVITLARFAVGNAFSPRLVEFTFPRPAKAARYEHLFRCPLRFGARANRCVLSPEWARFPLPSRDPWALATTMELLGKELASRRDQQDLLEVLEVAIARSLPDVPPFVEQARHHSTSERTLRRRLADCGTTYEALVDGVRRERVDQLLRRTSLTLHEIARRVGFADERALRRAVKRWYGMAPLQLRRDMEAREAAGV